MAGITLSPPTGHRRYIEGTMRAERLCFFGATVSQTGLTQNDSTRITVTAIAPTVRRAPRPLHRRSQ